MSYLQFLVDYASGMAENVWLDFYITMVVYPYIQNTL